MELNLLKNSALLCIVIVTFNKKKKEKLQKSETCIFEDVDTLTKINV